jgi:hypothetical protein
MSSLPTSAEHAGSPPTTAGTDSGDVAAVRAAAHAYERALVDGDTAAAAGWFAGDDDISRFGPEGSQFGRDEVAALRASTAAVAAPEWLYEDVRPLAGGVVLHLALLQRGSTRIQRSQVWVRRDDGWRITHAHVSRLTHGATS